MKFSDAISSIWPRWRSSSLREQRRDVGIDVVEPRAREVLEGLLRDGHGSVMLRERRDDTGDRLGGRRGALADDARLGAGEVEHRRRRARQLAGVDDGADTRRGSRSGCPRARGDPARRRRSRSSRRRRRPPRTTAAGRPAARARGRRSRRDSSPVSQRKRRAGFGEDRACTARAGSARAIASARPRSSGSALERARRRRRRGAPTASRASRPFSA